MRIYVSIVIVIFIPVQRILCYKLFHIRNVRSCLQTSKRNYEVELLKQKEQHLQEVKENLIKQVESLTKDKAELKEILTKDKEELKEILIKDKEKLTKDKEELKEILTKDKDKLNERIDELKKQQGILEVSYTMAIIRLYYLTVSSFLLDGPNPSKGYVVSISPYEMFI